MKPKRKLRQPEHPNKKLRKPNAKNKQFSYLTRSTKHLPLSPPQKQKITTGQQETQKAKPQHKATQARRNTKKITALAQQKNFPPATLKQKPTTNAKKCAQARRPTKYFKPRELNAALSLSLPPLKKKNTKAQRDHRKDNSSKKLRKSDVK